MVIVRQLPALVPVLERKLAQLVPMVVWLIPLDPAPILLLMERHVIRLLMDHGVLAVVVRQPLATVPVLERKADQ